MRPSELHQFLAKQKREALSKAWAEHSRTQTTDYGDFDVTYYRLNLTFDDARSRLSGSVTLRATSLADNQSSINLDLFNALQVDGVSGRTTVFTHQNDHLQLQFTTPLVAGESFEVTVSYHGQPTAAGFQGLTFDTQNTGPIISSLSEPYFARSWWPCKDVPSDKADSADIIITTDNSLIPVSNGILVSIDSTSASTHTYHWQVRYPITTYLISVAISNYHHLTDRYIAASGDTMPLDYYIYPQEDESNTVQYIMQTRHAIEIFASLYGEYPFINEKYGMASFNWGGAMEHQTISSMGAYFPSIIVHELSHQWWGDMVTTRNWHHIWLNEGFASYSEALYFENKYGEDTYHTYIEDMAYRGSGTIYVTDTTNVNRIFDSHLSYDKAAYVLHMLRHVVGDSTFFRALAHYRNLYYMGTATTEDFQHAVEDVSGMDLSDFFFQWIYSSGVPNYEYCLWSTASDGGYETNVCVNQTQSVRSTPTFVMPIDIQLSDSIGHDTTVVIQNTERSQSFTFVFPWQPTIITFDPGNWLLKTAEQVPANLARDGCEDLTTFFLASNYPNPFNDTTLLQFALPAGGSVTGVIYDITGHKVRELLHTSLQPGQYTLQWDGKDDDGQTVSTGVYLFKLSAAHLTRTDKMVFLK